MKPITPRRTSDLSGESTVESSEADSSVGRSDPRNKQALKALEAKAKERERLQRAAERLNTIKALSADADGGGSKVRRSFGWVRREWTSVAVF